MAAHAEDLERAVGAQLRHQARDLGGADVQRHDEVLVVSRHRLSRFSSGTRSGEAVGIAQIDVLVPAREPAERRGIDLDEAGEARLGAVGVTAEHRSAGRCPA